MPRPGRKFELVAARIEAALIGSDPAAATRAGEPIPLRPGLTIESPGFLKDIHGGRREFDVLVIQKVGHHTIRIALECRERGRPVGVPDVEAFHAKCDASRVHNAVMVSSSGYAESARTAAANLGVRCLDLTAVDSFDWLKTDALLCDVFIIDSDVRWESFAPGVNPKDVPNFRVRLDGAQVPEERKRSTVEGAIQYLTESNPARFGQPGSYQEVVELPTRGFTLLDVRNGAAIVPTRVGLIFKWELRTESVPLRPMSYGERGEGTLAEAAIATIDIDHARGDLSVLRTPDGRLMATFSPAPRKGTADK